MSFTVVTYNVLATAYIRPEWYPRTPPVLLRPERRIPALVEHVARLDAGVICLQEVEADVFDALTRSLAADGYAGALSRKAQGKPDGCAAFLRTRSARLKRTGTLAYDDGGGTQPRSGHIAQILVVEFEGRPLGIANTHLKWDPPGTAREEQFGPRQIAQLLKERRTIAAECAGWIVCGDLNVTPDSDVVAAMTANGFAWTHAASPGAATCNPNGQSKLIDYLFYDAALEAQPQPLAAVRDDTPLPGPGQPSDHIAVAARFEWRR